MMGPRQVEQASLFYEFSLERHVPAGHLLRSIDRFVDLSALRRELAPFYSSTGPPSNGAPASSYGPSAARKSAMSCAPRRRQPSPTYPSRRTATSSAG